ncbi:RNA polymerase sigma factor [Nocardioides marmotae]|uniref:RNA polymerase sigma factor n=1 Tax=Nocardioides marmotae TaxID=2663857 RepID=UPI0012B602A1|nr:RNA polymerase sigma factor [Nocardioides marmotae]MBC9731981.1 RNA polymerase sigma factor [Nocardioides marmotae]MTB83102.1 sigma-70 family RNA polymerase sigma factor [Nocardioides marmotae]
MTKKSGVEARDEEWFEGLFSRHHGAVRAFCLRRAGPDSDDVLAEVFAVAWRKRDGVPEHALPWLYAVASREVLHGHRSQGRRAGYEEQVARWRNERVDEFEDVDERLSAQSPVRAAMERLRPGDAEILRLWAWEELSSVEIATVLGISRTAARVRLHRARSRLEGQLRSLGITDHVSTESSSPPSLRRDRASEALEACHE